ncbi:MAG: efflux transporter outer membrane subunit [Desulfobacterales bacterium]|nr:efflux transporter outer membrane subunit [Desulfobacterales bacterium]
MTSRKYLHSVGVLSDRYFINHTLYLLLTALLLVSLIISGCTQSFQEQKSSPVLFENSDTFETPEDRVQAPRGDKWWHIFNDRTLDSLITDALAHNFTIQQYYARLKQSRAIAKRTDSRLYPEITGEISQDKFFNRDRVDSNATFGGIRLSWEIDFWNRLSSAAKAASFDTMASQEELETAALLLTTEIATTFFRIIEQQQQYLLLTEQIETNKKTLKILRLRFAQGGSSLIDIYQQQEQLVATQAGLPQVTSQLIALQYRLSVLLGSNPIQAIFSSTNQLPDLPSVPDFGIPADLLLNRPDLRYLNNLLEASGYRIDEARTDRLPRITVGARSGIRGSGIRSDELFLSFFGELIAPIIDWGRRKAEVERTEAVYEELVARFNQTFLIAIEEVQTALWRETKQQELIHVKDEQLAVSRSALLESQKRYLQGVSDYLPVLNSLNSTQRLEREIITLQSNLLLIRISLYQAIGNTIPLIGPES